MADDGRPPTVAPDRRARPRGHGMDAVRLRTPGVPPTRTGTDSTPRHAPISKRRSAYKGRVLGLRNEKVRGPNPLSSTYAKAALARRDGSPAADSLSCDCGRSASGVLPVCPGRFRRSNSARSAEAPAWCRYTFVVATEACPIQACTVTRSSLRASQRHAAVCRKSWDAAALRCAGPS